MPYTVTATTTTPKDIGFSVKLIDQITEVEADNSLESLKRKMQRYPSRPPGSTYQRTGRLKRSWRLEKANNILASRGVPYARYVQADNDQAGIHRGRWTTEVVAVEREMKTYRRNVKRAINRIQVSKGGTKTTVNTVFQVG